MKEYHHERTFLEFGSYRYEVKYHINHRYKYIKYNMIWGSNSNIDVVGQIPRFEVVK